MGEANGSLKAKNGHANGHSKGKPVQTHKRGEAGKKQRGFLGWISNQIARLATWFVLLTIAFRCPQTLEHCDETSPFICSYYFHAKALVVPQVKPYYDHYAAPYVDIAYPYYETVDNHVLTPARTYAVHYSAPYVQQAQAYGWAQWEKNGQPQLEHYQALAMDKYEEVVAPHVAKANDALAPYYDIAVTNGYQMYYEHLLPSYAFVQPYLAQGYDVASEFASTTLLPSAYWALNKTYVFVDATLWPQIRVLYVENVEPQLVRIGERLGRYKTKMASSAPIVGSEGGDSESQSTFNKPTSHQATSASAAESTKLSDPVIPSAEEVEDFINPVEAPEAGDNESDNRKKAREMVAQDLEMWQTKFAAQADEGANAIEERVAEITKELEQSGALASGRDLVDKLEAVIQSELESLKQSISAAIDGMNDNKQSATEASVGAVRSAGMAIKEAASAVRDWRRDYNAKLEKEVTKAADTHFQILDETRNLALQQLGMRWAWTDGITYKDWAKYHELKKTLSQWTNQLKELIVTDPNLVKAQEASALVEDESMELASVAAKELARLKEVAQWKIVAKDATENFESEAMKLAAEAAEAAELAKREAEKKAEAARREAVEQAQKAQEEAAKRAAQAEEVVVEPVFEAVSSVSDYADDAASTVAEHLEHVAASAASFAGEAKVAIVEEASSASEIAENQSTAASQSASSILSEGDEVTSEVREELSATVRDAFGHVSEVADDAASVISEPASRIFSDASNVATEAGSSVADLAEEAEERIPEPFASQASKAAVNDEAADNGPIVEEDPPTEKEDAPKVDQAASVKPAFLGAAAQEVPKERKPILDDYIDTDIISDAAASASAAYSNALAAASEQYSSAVSVVSAQIYGTPKPVHEQLFSSVSGAYENAIAAASAKYEDAVSAASNGLKRAPETPTPTALVDWSKVESIASQRLNEGRLWAEVQYQSALIALGVATATPTSTSDKVLQEAKKNYYAGLGLAQERYAHFMSAASSAMYSLTATPTPTDFAGTARSLASAAQETVASVVNVAEDAVNSAYSAATDNVADAISAVDGGIQSAIDGVSEQMYLAGAALADTWDQVVSELNLQIYGAEPSQIGWYDNLFKDATSAASVASDAAAEKVAAASNAAEDSAVTASAEALKQYEAVSNLVSELIHGKEPSFTESVLSRLGEVYATAASNVGNFANEAGAAASSIGDKVNSAASQATDAVKESVQHVRDEL